jgi:hypothetical protein
MGGEGDRTTSNNWILRFFMGTVAAASLKRLPRRGTSNCKPDKENNHKKSHPEENPYQIGKPLCASYVT